MTAKKLFGVIVPCFNSSATILRCLESVAHQTRMPDEVIVIDDCSSDDSVFLVESFFKRSWPFDCKLIKLAANSGPAAARNVGMRELTTAYVAFLDSDDFWKPNHLWVANQILSQLPNKECFISHVPDLLKATGVPNTGSQNAVQFRKRSPLRLAFIQGIGSSSSIVSLSVAKSVGLFPENIRFCEDLCFYLRSVCLIGEWVELRSPKTAVLGSHFFVKETGVSWNLERMHKGALQALDLSIGESQYKGWLPVLRVWHFLKYLRRMFIKSLSTARKSMKDGK